jgi:hypothetical protein
MNESFFIGYETLERWQATSPVTKTAYAMPISTIHADGGFVAKRELAVLVSKVDGPLMHYVKIIFDTLTYLHGEYVDTSADEDRRLAKPENACAVIHEWLVKQGYTVVRAAIAVPVNVSLLDGWADFLEYDQETGQFTRKNSPKPPHPTSQALFDLARQGIENLFKDQLATSEQCRESLNRLRTEIDLYLDALDD